MKISKRHMWMILLSAFALVPLVAGYGLKYKNTLISCDGELVTKSKTDGYHVVMHYRFYNGSGSYNSIGHAVHDNDTTRSVNRSFTFRYLPEGNDITLLSMEDDHNPEDIEHHTALIPDFFRFKDRGLNIRISKENNAGYLIIQGETPIFYCRR